MFVNPWALVPVTPENIDIKTINQQQIYSYIYDAWM